MILIVRRLRDFRASYYSLYFSYSCFVYSFSYSFVFLILLFVFVCLAVSVVPCQSIKLRLLARMHVHDPIDASRMPFKAGLSKQFDGLPLVVIRPVRGPLRVS